MHVYINDKRIHIPEVQTIQGALQYLDYPQQGTALAVNQVIIPQRKWASVLLKDADRITIFQIITGG